MYGINIQQLICFFTVVEHLSFSKAAEQLYIAQPALSKRIANLESTLGVKLFERGYRGVTVTEAGTYLYNKCRPLIDQLCGSLSQLQSTWGTLPRTLTINCMTTLQTDPVILQNIYRYKAEHPKSALAFEVLEMNDLRKSFCNQEADAYIAPSFVFGDTPDVCKRVIQETSVYINIAKSHPLAGKADLTLADLQSETFCLSAPAKSGEMINQPFYRLCQSYGFIPEHVQYAKTISAREAAVLLGCISVGTGLFNPEQILHIPVNRITLGNEIVLAWYRENKSKELLSFVKLFPDLKTLTTSAPV